MKLILYQADAFANSLFSGNPAAIIPLEQWISPELMQDLAMENNLAETAFFVPVKGSPTSFDIRWFTPASEIDLCGHATLASAFILYEFLGYDQPTITFQSKSGPLFISRENENILLDFPSWPPERIESFPPDLIRSIGNPEIAGVYKNRDYIIELDDEEAVKKCKPDFSLMKTLRENVMVTAKGTSADFVSRFFAPYLGIDEDPVTGSAHSQLIPLWSYKLGKEKMKAKQLSRRGGDITCELKGDRVIMGGKCVFYMKGEIDMGKRQ